MGLDMYLMRKHYIWGDDVRKNLKITGLKNPVDPEKVSYIVEEVGYWRKANAIHQWFVDNVQGGADDCGNYYVGKDQLKELRGLCQTVVNGSKLISGKVVNGQRFDNDTGKFEDVLQDGKVIENPSLAEELLPTTSGFFFGGTQYNEWYIDELKNTIKIIDEALEGSDGEYEYSSSW